MPNPQLVLEFLAGIQHSGPLSYNIEFSSKGKDLFDLQIKNESFEGIEYNPRLIQFKEYITSPKIRIYFLDQEQKQNFIEILNNDSEGISIGTRFNKKITLKILEKGKFKFGNLNVKIYEIRSLKESKNEILVYKSLKLQKESKNLSKNIENALKAIKDSNANKESEKRESNEFEMSTMRNRNRTRIIDDDFPLPSTKNSNLKRRPSEPSPDLLEIIQRSMRKLKKLKVLTQESAGKICSICFDDSSHFDARLPCSHMFCYSCIKDWSKVCTKCPMCKGLFDFIMRKKEGSWEKEIVESCDRLAEPLEIVDNSDDFCYICSSDERPHQMLVCDSCNFYCCHIYCMNPARTDIPDDDWFCNFCISSNENLNFPSTSLQLRSRGIMRV